MTDSLDFPIQVQSPAAKVHTRTSTTVKGFSQNSLNERGPVKLGDCRPWATGSRSLTVSLR